MRGRGNRGDRVMPLVARHFLAVVRIWFASNGTAVATGGDGVVLGADLLSSRF